MNNRFFNIDPDKIDIINKIIVLQEIDASMELVIEGEEELYYKGNSYKKTIFAREVPDKSFPKSCLYIVEKKSSNQGSNIVNVEYFNETAILATKITGSAYVPSGEPNFRLHMISHKLEMRYSWRGHRNPYWNTENNVFDSSTTDQIRLKRVSNGVVDTLVHISQFTTELKYLDKGKFKNLIFCNNSKLISYFALCNFLTDKEFRVVLHENEIPFGWRLASVEEIKKDGTYTEAARDVIEDELDEGYLCLDDDFKVVK